MIAVAVLHLSADYSYVLFHSLVEISRITVLGGIFLLAWNSRQWGGNSFLLTIGIAAFFVGGIEILHALAYKGLAVFRNSDANLPTQLWIAFRYLESLSYLAATLVVGRVVSPLALIPAYLLITLMLLGSIGLGLFPDCYLEPAGLTDFKIVSEYVIVGIFMASLVLLFQRRRHFDRGVLALLMASMVCGMFAELAFTRYVSVYGMANELGHYLLLTSAYLLYRAVLVTGLVAPFDLLFRDLKRNEAELEARVLERTAALQKSEAQATAFAENSPSIIYMMDLQGRYTQANRAFERYIGVSRAEILGKTVFDLFPPHISETLDRHNQSAMREQRVAVIDEHIRIGEWDRTFETVYFPILGADGQIVGSGGVATDVTDMRLAEARYGTIVKTSMDAFIIWDAQGYFKEVNQAACELTGYDRETLLSLHLRDVKHSEDAAVIADRLRETQARGFSRFDSRWRRRDGTSRDVEVSVNFLDDVPGGRFFGFVRDITERKAAMDEIEYLAHHDHLTGLPNKLLFQDRFARAAEQASQAGKKLAMLYLDFDNFKVVNDTLGHAVGDALIKRMSERLASCLDAGDLLGRISGDEFVVLLKDVLDDAAVIRVASQILHQLSLPMDIDQHQLVTTVSLGVSLFPVDGTDFDTLYKNADTAMFQAKESGRNAYRFFNDRMNAEALERLNLLSRLRGGLERQEFVLHYQPQIDLNQGRVLGAEALIRWQSPEFGLVAPGRFIPIAEDSGLIVEIGAWVLREACRQATLWRGMGFPDFVVAVNLSAVQFRSDNLYGTVTDALLASGLDPSGLELELTESILIRDTELVLDTVKRLKLLGLKMSIDDFGTGYSSLSYLKRFPVDKLKIDQSFVRDLGKDPEDSALVHAIIQMARSFGLRTIAEGVEHEYLIDHLRLHHCDEAQGYFYGRPMPSEAFGEYLRAQRK